MLHVTVWMNMPSFYQSDLFRALIDTNRIDLEVIFARRLAPERRQLGWREDLAGYPYRFLDTHAAVLDALRLARARRERLHIINGLWAEPAFAAAMAELMLLGSRYAVYSEAPEPNRGQPLVRRLLKHTFGPRAVRKAAGLLPVSHLGEAFFKDLGASAESIYPFGYFRSAAHAPGNLPPRQGGIELIYVGQLTHRKGLSILLDALEPLWSLHADLTLSIVGSGEDMDSLRSRTESARLSGRVRFEGTLSADSIPQRIARADALVLPSRWDGWGLVANEALSVGVPVVISNRCGAADLIRTGVNGWVFHSEDMLDLRRCLQAWLERRSDWPRLRAAALASGAKISAGAVAPYVVECLECIGGLRNERPLAPWLP